MGKSSVAYYQFEIKPRKPKHPDVERSVNDVNHGIGVLPYFKSYLDFQKCHGFLKDSRKHRIIGISDYEVHGKTIFVKAVSGMFGEEAQLIDVLSGQNIGRLGKDSAAVRECRVVLACPLGTNLAEFAVEYREESEAYFLLKEFARQLRTLFVDCVAPIKPILEKEVWMENGRLKELSFPLQGHQNQITVSGGLEDDSEEQSDVAQLVLGVRPGGKNKFFTQNVWNSIRHGGLDTNAYLTLPNDLAKKANVRDIGLRATVEGPNNVTKSFLIGNEKYPTIRELLTDSGMPYLSDATFRDRIGNQIYTNYKDTGLALRSGWDTGVWNGNDLTTQPDWQESANDDDEEKE